MSDVAPSVARYLRLPGGFGRLAACLMLIPGWGMTRESAPLEDLRTKLSGSVTLHTLATDEGSLLLAPELGGKIIGLATRGAEGRNLLFTHARLGEPGFLTEMTDFFNPGGDRCWIAPSPRFNFDARGTFRIPRTIDPGAYRVIESSATRLVMASRMPVTDNQENSFDLELRREIEVVAVPRAAGLEQNAYRCTNRLINRSAKTVGKDLPLVAPKTFVEVAPPGDILIALSPAAAANPAVNYLDPFPTGRDGDILTVRVDGGRDGQRQKLGLPALAVTGRLAFVAALGPDRAMALVRVFPLAKGDCYIENRDEARGKPGDAIQIYDDDRRFGGFTEMEELGPAGPLARGEELVHSVTTYAITGPDRDVRSAVRRLLGAR